MVAVAEKKGVNYQAYRYGRSRQRFRGPKPDLSSPYMSFIGGSDVFGKFVSDPFPAIIQKKLNHQCANWGTPGAGPTFFLRDPVILEACSNSKVCVISVMGAVAMSNRLYSVFKRRNSRLRDTSEALQALYPQMRLGEFRFAHNMLRRMYAEDPSRFKLIEIELRQAWVARMRDLLEEIETTRVLLWMSTRAPDDHFGLSDTDSFVTHPAFVSREMLEEVTPMADLVVEYVPSEAVATAGYGKDVDMDMDAPALPCPSQAMHFQVAELLADPLNEALKLKKSSASKWLNLRGDG